MPRFFFNMGHIAGVPLRVHWLVLPALLAVIVLLGPFYGSLPGGYALAAVVALLLWLSLLLHEIGHVLVAQRCGMRVFRIMIYAPGGTTEIDDTHAAPWRELRVALAGPIVNLLLGLLAGLIWWGVADRVVQTVAMHLAAANIAVALFNLLPGHLLDGGRALRAVFWFLSDDELTAGRIAVWIARGTGWALLVLAVMYGLTRNDLPNAIWIGFLGFFIGNGATDGYRHVALRRALRDVRVADLMQRSYRSVAPDLRLDQFVGSYVLGQADFGIPVVSQTDPETPALLGMMTLRNLRRFATHQWPLTSVQQAMTPAERVVALTGDTTASDALHLLLEHEVEQLPVLNGSHLVGMVSRRDLARFIEQRAAAVRH